MSEYKLTDLFSDIANSIRSKTHRTNTIIPMNFPQEIRSIEQSYNPYEMDIKTIYPNTINYQLLPNIYEFEQLTYCAYITQNIMSYMRSDLTTKYVTGGKPLRIHYYPDDTHTIDTDLVIRRNGKIMDSSEYIWAATSGRAFLLLIRNPYGHIYIQLKQGNPLPEYLISTPYVLFNGDTSYDLGIIPNQSTEVDITFSFQGSDNTPVFGTNRQSANKEGYHLTRYSGKWYYGCFSNTDSSYVGGTSKQTVLFNKDRAIYVNEGLVAQTNPTYQDEYPLLLAGRADLKSKGKFCLYSLNIKQNDVEYNYCPALNKETGKYGLYEFNNDMFYPIKNVFSPTLYASGYNFCTIKASNGGNITFTKYSDGEAFYCLLDIGKWTGPLLISEDLSAVAYDPHFNNTIAYGDENNYTMYNNKKYYYGSTDYYLRNIPTIDHPMHTVVLGSRTMAEAAYEALDWYFNGGDI